MISPHFHVALARSSAVLALFLTGSRASLGAAATYGAYVASLLRDPANGGVRSPLTGVEPYTGMKIGGHRVDVHNLPRGLVNHPGVGIVTADWLDDIEVIQRFPLPPADAPPIRRTSGGIVQPFTYVDCPRLVVTKTGEYVLSVIAGWGHYGGVLPSEKINDILLYRSSDRGRSWTGPYLSTPIPYNQHAWVPLRPRGSSRIYMFSTEPAPGDFNGIENGGIGIRHSDDDGHTWSGAARIRPLDDPGFQGMWCIGATETARGTWLIAPHTGSDYHGNQVVTHLYVLRTTDLGRTWTLLPGPRPSGWQWEPGRRMDEGRPIAIGERVVLFSRTFEGHLFRCESDDDGKTWSPFKATPLVHPDAPPMINTLSDGHTLIALIHNRFSGGPFSREDRSELWVSCSKDAGITWSEPRFLAVTSVYAPHSLGGAQYCVTYCEADADHGQLSIFIPHLWRQVLCLRLRESDLERLPTRRDLFPQA